MFKGVGRQLEFIKLLEKTAALARSEPGRYAVLHLSPSTRRTEVERNLQITDTL
jgi:DNA mismatch repair protein MutS2